MRTLIACCAVLAAASCVAAQEPETNDEPLSIICFGAHPDDAEYKSGGTAALWAAAKSRG